MVARASRPCIERLEQAGCPFTTGKRLIPEAYYDNVRIRGGVFVPQTLHGSSYIFFK